MRPSALFPLLGLLTSASANLLRRRAPPTYPHPLRVEHSYPAGSPGEPITANASVLASLSVHASPSSRASMVSHVRSLGKQGRISAQWYPGYAAELLPVDEIDWATTDLLFWFVQTTDAGGLNATVDGPLHELVLEAAMHGVPVVATVGGWDGGMWFSQVVANQTARQGFVKQVEAFVSAHHLSGWEIDWEYPGSTNNVGCNNVSALDLRHLGEFFVDLRAALGPDMLITIDVSSGGLIGAKGDVNMALGNWSEPLDYFNIMNYDTYGSWSTTTGPNAALSDLCSGGWSKFGAISSIALFTAAGVPPGKLLLGMPGYGYSYIATSWAPRTRHAEFANGTKGAIESYLFQNKTKKQPEGDLTDSEGIDVCGNFESWSGTFIYKSLINYGFLSANGKTGENGFTRYWDECSSTPFLYTPSNNTLISYDDASSLAIKTSYQQDQGLAGVTVFDSTGPTRELWRVIKMATEDRAALWAQGIMTIENATVVVDKPKDP